MAFDITNFYEPMVASTIARYVEEHPKMDDFDHSFLEDAACIALNQLPARYVRHHVDLCFYLTSEEREQMELAVDKAVTLAFTRLSHDPRNPELS